MTGMPPAIRLVRELSAAPEEVFDAWTDPASMRAWMCHLLELGDPITLRHGQLP